MYAKKRNPKSYVRCENHKNETLWKKHDQKNSSRRNNEKMLRKKPDRRKKRKKNDKTRREKQSGEREEEKLCNRPMILVVARADPLRIWKNCFRYEWTLSMWPWTPRRFLGCVVFCAPRIDVVVFLIAVCLLFCGAKAFYEINYRYSRVPMMTNFII